MNPKEKKLLKLSSKAEFLRRYAKYNLAVIHVFQLTNDDNPKKANRIVLKTDLINVDLDGKFSLAVTYDDNDSLLDMYISVG